MSVYIITKTVTVLCLSLSLSLSQLLSPQKKSSSFYVKSHFSILLHLSAVKKPQTSNVAILIPSCSYCYCLESPVSNKHHSDR